MLLELSRELYVEDGTRKPDHYLAVYEQLLSPLRDSPVRLLELGVSSGASLLLWQRYFPNAYIVGLDIIAPPERLADQIQKGAIKFVRGDQSNPADLMAAGDEFDIIIDDASHLGGLTRASFEYLFPNALKPGGFYFIED